MLTSGDGGSYQPDSQLKELLDIFHAHNLKYWLDSGTLLHLMRDRCLAPHDEDLDIYMWKEEAPRLEKVLPLIREAGYMVYSYAYKGLVFKYNFIPRDGRYWRTVDVALYHKFGDYAWYPMFYFKVNPSKEKSGGRNEGFVGRARGVIRGAWKKINARLPLHIDIGRLPWRPFLNIGVWWIPQHYFRDIVYHEDLGAYLPAEWENYLAFRYGRWQEPVREWIFYRDDGGVRDTTPEELNLPL